MNNSIFLAKSAVCFLFIGAKPTPIVTLDLLDKSTKPLNEFCHSDVGSKSK